MILRRVALVAAIALACPVTTAAFHHNNLPAKGNDALLRAPLDTPEALALHHSVGGGAPFQRRSDRMRYRRAASIMKMALAGGEDDDDDDEDDDDIDDIDVDSLGDWRQFRMNLAQSGIQTQESSEGATDAKKDESIVQMSSPERPKSVSKKNEELLKTQNAELWEEYRGGVWAHEAPNAEVGGVVCRLPLEAEIYRNTEHSVIGKKLHALLDGNNDDSLDQLPSASSADAKGSSPGVSFSPLAAKTVFWYRKAKKLIEKEINKVTSSATGGEIDASKLGPESLDMLNLYLDHQDTWQEVCLVLERDEKNGTATTLVLNRPMAFQLTENLARLVLFGAYSSEDVANMELMVKFLIAFDKEIAIYVGGPDHLDQKALLIHGIKDLAGAEEIAPGTGIYRGGLAAAVDGIMQGMYKPMDFRFFVGRHRYSDGKLDLDVLLGKYQPIACARSLVLKQCKALPKPLYHEALELCGGELKEISSLELMKRNDIQFDDE